jgi:hypothetical protein
MQAPAPAPPCAGRRLSINSGQRYAPCRWPFLLLLILSGCGAYYENPNTFVYGWRPPGPPDPASRSYLGYDFDYEQQLIDRYVASHQEEVRRFRAANGLVE